MSGSVPPSRKTGSAFAVFAVIAILVLAHLVAFVPSEPFFNNDETRHVMTGVYFRDALCDRPSPGDLRDYTIRYYLQYPALGLLIWPPAFYGIEGLTFLLFGDSFLVARLLVGAFALMACVYLFLLVQRTHNRTTTVAATLFLGLSPLVFHFADRVMLEVPTLAWSLMAAFHFRRFLDMERKRDLSLCCLAMALTALTRFDGVFLAPFFLIWLIAAGKWKLLKRPSVLIGVGVAVLAVVPVYYLTAREFGGAHLKAVNEGTSPDSTAFLAPRNFIFYPRCIPRQIGWAALLPLLLGFVGAWRADRRSASWPYLALVFAVYATFTPLAELENRHAIYWVPALAVFVVEGCRVLANALAGGSRLHISIMSVVLAGVGVQTWIQGRSQYVFGYERAARYVAQHNDETPVCLFDGFLNGSFIYHLRRLDPERRLWVLRGDKLFYGMLSDPHAGYEEYVKTPSDVLRLIDRYDPELIVIEEPQVHFDLPGARLLRQTLHENPTRFTLKETFPLDSDHPYFKDHALHVYRNEKRNPVRADVLELKVLGLGRSVTAPMNAKE